MHHWDDCVLWIDWVAYLCASTCLCLEIHCVWNYRQDRLLELSSVFAQYIICGCMCKLVFCWWCLCYKNFSLLGHSRVTTDNYLLCRHGIFLMQQKMFLTLYYCMCRAYVFMGLRPGSSADAMLWLSVSSKRTVWPNQSNTAQDIRVSAATVCWSNAGV